MELKYRIEHLSDKKLVGKRLEMSFLNDGTADLWKAFMPFRNEIGNRAGEDLYAVQIYKKDFFKTFDPSAEFIKWAAVEVSDPLNIPEILEELVLPGGLYAVFHYKGSSSQGREVFGYIFNEWLPNSPYELDDRPHFEILGEKYRNNDPASEEEICIPIRNRE